MLWYAVLGIGGPVLLNWQCSHVNRTDYFMTFLIIYTSFAVRGLNSVIILSLLSTYQIVLVSHACGAERLSHIIVAQNLRLVFKQCWEDPLSELEYIIGCTTQRILLEWCRVDRGGKSRCFAMYILSAYWNMYYACLLAEKIIVSFMLDIMIRNS